MSSDTNSMVPTGVHAVDALCTSVCTLGKFMSVPGGVRVCGHSVTVNEGCMDGSMNSESPLVMAECSMGAFAVDLVTVDVTSRHECMTSLCCCGGSAGV